jgi:hypothetical protein
MANRRDSFHDCGANTGTPIHMKDSIQSGIAPGATGSSHISGCFSRTVGKELAKPGLSSQLATGDAALAKQVVMGRWILDSQNPPGKTGSSRDESSHGPTDQQ